MVGTEGEDEEAAYDAASDDAHDAVADVAHTTYEVAYDAIYARTYSEARQLGGYDAIDATVAAHHYADNAAYELASEAAYEVAIAAVNVAFARFGILCYADLAVEIADYAALEGALAARGRRQLYI